MADREGLYIALHDANLRWGLKRAALERRMPLRNLVADILRAWLEREGTAQ